MPAACVALASDAPACAGKWKREPALRRSRFFVLLVGALMQGCAGVGTGYLTLTPTSAFAERVSVTLPDGSLRAAEPSRYVSYVYKR